MKKLLGIVVLSLLWCNVGFAEYFEFRKCHFDTFNSFDERNKKSKLGPVVEDVVTIDTDAGTVTRTIIRDKEGAKTVTEILSAIGGKKVNTNRITQTIYNLLIFRHKQLKRLVVKLLLRLRTKFFVKKFMEVMIVMKKLQDLVGLHFS